MSKVTEQMVHWAGRFGKEYTDRNALSIKEMNNLHEKYYGISRTKLYEAFIGGLDRTSKILEVGSNVGDQLLCLQKMGFKDLSGIELQRYAVEIAKARTKGIDIIQGSAFDIPFKDRYFDLVFTSGVLIHIDPTDLKRALKEVHRCAKKHILGLEYYAEKPTEAIYRGHRNLLWKQDFAKLYLKTFPDLTLVKEEHLKYRDGDNVDTMYLLGKR